MRAIPPALRAACDAAPQPDTARGGVRAAAAAVGGAAAAYTGGGAAAREALMGAATHAGIAFSNASVTLIHGMSRWARPHPHQYWTCALPLHNGHKYS
jgi:alcohol dehydrogenase class IV